MKLTRKSNKSVGIRHLLLPTVSTIAALVAGTVHAQQASAPAAKGEASDKLETITVTATKRSEPLQSVPIAITVLGGEQLEQSNLNTLGAITTQTPTVNLSGASVPVSIAGTQSAHSTHRCAASNTSGLVRRQWRILLKNHSLE